MELLHYCILPSVSIAAFHFLGILWNIVLVRAPLMGPFSPVIVGIRMSNGIYSMALLCMEGSMPIHVCYMMLEAPFSASPSQQRENRMQPCYLPVHPPGTQTALGE